MLRLVISSQPASQQHKIEDPNWGRWDYKSIQGPFFHQGMKRDRVEGVPSIKTVQQRQ